MKLTIKISDSDLQELEKLKQGSYLDMINYRSKRQIAAQSIKTLVYEEIRRNLRVWIQNIFSPFCTAVLYFLIFGYILGSKIGTLNGIPYVNFLVPGFLVMPVMGAAFGNGVFTTFMRKYFKTIQYIQTSPINVHSFIIGITIAGVLRGLLVAFLIWLASVLFTGTFVVHSPVMAIVVLILVCTMFSLAGMINALYANTFEQINFIPTFILTPLSYLSGIFFDVNTLPTFFAKLSLLNPIAYVVSSFRYTFLGAPEANLLVCISFFILIIIALYFYVNRLLRKKLNIC